MKPMKSSLMAVCLVSALTIAPAWSGDSKEVKEKVVIEETPNKWWGIEASTGWDSLYMFRGVNLLRNDKQYGSSLYWLDANFTWNITENDSINIGAWAAFGLDNTNYEELDLYVSYTRTFGNLSLTAGYINYIVFDGPFYQNDLFATAAYDFDLGFMTLTPSIGYYFNVGPGVENEGVSPVGGSYMTLRLDGDIPVYKEIVSLAPWVGFNFNFRYNAKEIDGGADTRYFNGANNFELGLSLPIQVTENITVSGYVAYSYQWQNLVSTQPSTVWSGASISFGF